MKEYTYETVLADLREIVQQKGEDTTADCIYAERDDYGWITPVCIVGHFLWNHALIEADEWHRIEDHNADYALDFLEKERRSYFTTDARKLLVAVQGRQDQGNSWGWSLESAVTELSEEES